jgi:hypothetical protein
VPLALVVFDAATAARCDCEGAHFTLVVEVFLSQQLEVAAGVLQQLEADAAQLQGRVIRELARPLKGLD